MRCFSSLGHASYSSRNLQLHPMIFGETERVRREEIERREVVEG